MDLIVQSQAVASNLVGLLVTEKKRRAVPDTVFTSNAKNWTRITTDGFSNRAKRRHRERTEDSVGLRVLFIRIHAYERAEIMVGNLAIVSGKTRSMFPQRQERGRKTTHTSINFRHRFFPSALFIQSSSSLRSFWWESAASSGNSLMVRSKISSSILTRECEGEI